MIRTLGGLCTLVLCCTLGCGGSTSSVSGRVTLDGQPLTKGTITFNPTGDAPAAIGQISSSGSYRLSVGTSSSVAPGQYQVTIVATELVEPTPTDPSPLPKMLTPEKYNDPATSDLTADVKRGANRFDFELTSTP
jgi:hypothetical protein